MSDQLRFPYQRRLARPSPELARAAAEAARQAGREPPDLTEPLVEVAPVLDVWLLDADLRRRIRIPALVDTGSPASIWPAAVMADLGITEQECEPTFGLNQPGVQPRLEKPGGLHFEIVHNGAFYRFWAYATFDAGSPLYDLHGPFGLLGRDDFLDQVELTILHRERAFVLEPYELDPAGPRT